MSQGSRPTFDRLRFAGTVGVLTFGAFIIGMILTVELVATIVLVLGWFVIIPLVFLLGDAFPLVESGSSTESDRHDLPRFGSDEQGAAGRETNPLRLLQERYATGEIDEAEFERRLGRLIESDRVADGDRTPGRTLDEGPRDDREPAYDRDPAYDRS